MDIETRKRRQRLVREQILNEKVELVSEIKDRFTNAASAVVVEYRGLNVAAITDLRAQLHQEGVEFKVYKNTMTRRAVEDAGLNDLLESLTGPNAIAFSDDAVAPSRILSKFAKKNKALVIKQGMVEGEVVNADKIKELSELPNKEGMLAMLLGALQSPLRDFAWAVKQISELDTTEAGEETTQEEVSEAEQTAQQDAVEEGEKVVEEAPEDTTTSEVEVESAEETVQEVEEKEATEESAQEVETTQETTEVAELDEEVDTQVEDENENVEELVDEQPQEENETLKEVAESEEEK